MEKVGLKETLDVFALVQNTIDKSAAAMKGDGKISTPEAIGIAMSEMKDAIQAVSGASMIVMELKDLDDEEKTQLAQAGLSLAMSCMKLFKPDLAEQLAKGE